jgi:hypothetical protein
MSINCFSSEKIRFRNRLLSGSILLTVLIVVFDVSCSSSQLSESTINDRIINTVVMLNENGGVSEKVRDLRVGETGYYYIINSAGTVILHPKKMLEGMKFQDNPMVRKIIREGKGCIRQNIEGQDRIIFYRALNNDRVLCLTINASDIEDRSRIICDDLKGR